VWIAIRADGQNVVALARGDAPGMLGLEKAVHRAEAYAPVTDRRGTLGRGARPPAIALRSQARSHDITVTSGSHRGGQIPGSSRRRSRFGQVGEPADPLLRGEALLSPAACPPCAICSDTRFSPRGRVKWRPARDSLISRIISLMTRFNSLLGRNKFPVPMRRELSHKHLK
jgi:hypothetical protein